MGEAERRCWQCNAGGYVIPANRACRRGKSQSLVKCGICGGEGKIALARPDGAGARAAADNVRRLLDREARLSGHAKALGALVEAQKTLLAIYRLGDDRRGPAAADRVEEAQRRVDESYATLAAGRAGAEPGGDG